MQAEFELKLRLHCLLKPSSGGGGDGSLAKGAITQ